jgi:hypothetical protein
MEVDNPEPTSGRGRYSNNPEKSAGAEAVRDGAPLVTFKPQLTDPPGGKKQLQAGGLLRGEASVTSADMFAQVSAARAPVRKVRAQPFKPEKGQLKIQPRCVVHRGAAPRWGPCNQHD